MLPPGIAVMAIAPVVVVAVAVSDGAGAGGEVKAFFGMIHGGRDELLLSPRAGVLKQLLCWESLQIVVHPRISIAGGEI